MTEAAAPDTKPEARDPAPPRDADGRDGADGPRGNALDLLGRRWTLRLVDALLAGPARFVDLRRRVVGISGNVLAQRLHELRTLGLVEAVELPPPVAVAAYRLTPAGAALGPAIEAIGTWARDSFARPA